MLTITILYYFIFELKVEIINNCNQFCMHKLPKQSMVGLILIQFSIIQLKIIFLTNTIFIFILILINTI